MAYECPVCGELQADPPHLADHVAITAAARGGDHEEWLEEHVPGWAEMGPADLGPRIAERATERPDVEPRSGDAGGRPARLEDHLAAAGPTRGRGTLDDETADVLEEARRLTERMADDE